MLARRNQVSLLGIRRARHTGGDNEFERLREYTPDDDFRHIAWRATAKRDQPIVKAFQTTQNQSVVLLLDCGRMMRGKATGSSPLDLALDASMMLAQVALSRQDQVGMLAFSDRVEAYLPPRGGSGQLMRLIHLGHDRFPRLTSSNYEEALAYIHRVQRKRSLLVLITSVLDDASLGAIQKHLRAMRGRHLPLVVFLKSHSLVQVAERETSSDEEYYHRAAASEVLSWRSRSIRELRGEGVLVLDLYPEELDAAVISEYLRVKAAHLL